MHCHAAFSQAVHQWSDFWQFQFPPSLQYLQFWTVLHMLSQTNSILPSVPSCHWTCPAVAVYCFHPVFHFLPVAPSLQFYFTVAAGTRFCYHAKLLDLSPVQLIVDNSVPTVQSLWPFQCGVLGPTLSGQFTVRSVRSWSAQWVSLCILPHTDIQTYRHTNIHTDIHTLCVCTAVATTTCGYFKTRHLSIF